LNLKKNQQDILKLKKYEFEKNFIHENGFTKDFEIYKTMTENFEFLIIYLLIMNYH